MPGNPLGEVGRGRGVCSTAAVPISAPNDTTAGTRGRAWTPGVRRRHAAAVQAVITIGGAGLLTSLLDLPSERLRLAILKMIGILLSRQPAQMRTAMTKSAGFDTMWLLLAPFPITADLCDTLVGVGTDGPKLRARRPGPGISRAFVGAQNIVRSPDLRTPVVVLVGRIGGRCGCSYGPVPV